MTSKEFIELRNMIEREFSRAVTKHPKFCDMLADKQTDWNRLESLMKSRNDEYAPPYYGENIFLEEFAEAMNAYQLGHKEDAVNELAQCGAVILRMMEFVQNEINGGKE